MNSNRNIPIGSQLISCNCTIGLLSKVGFNMFIEATTGFWTDTHLNQNVCDYGNFMTRTQQLLPAKVVAHQETKTFPCQHVFFILCHCLIIITHYALMLTFRVFS